MDMRKFIRPVASDDDKKTMARMKQRGIHNSVADVWVHISPIDYMAYWYLRTVMLEYIEAEWLEPIAARSIDGTVTGSGYVISSCLPFIRPQQLEKRYFWPTYERGVIPLDDGAHVKRWLRMSQGEAGREAERIGLIMLQHGRINLPIRIVEKTDLAGEYASMDCTISIREVWKVEIKGDIKSAETGNLYVQTGERGHRHALIPVEGGK